MPYLWVQFINSTLNNNFGNTTNDIFAKSIKRFDFISSQWSQQYEQSDLPVKSQQNIAKFISLNNSDYVINVKNSTFDCHIPFDRDTVFN